MPYGHEVYSNIAARLNKEQFPTLVADYELSRHPLFENGTLLPWYTPDRNKKTRTVSTIAMMLDYVERTVPFEIIYTKDVIEVYRNINSYINELQEFRELPEAMTFITKGNNFITILLKSLNHLSKTDPEVKKILVNRNLTKFFDSPFLTRK